MRNFLDERKDFPLVTLGDRRGVKRFYCEGLSTESVGKLFCIRFDMLNQRGNLTVTAPCRSDPMPLFDLETLQLYDSKSLAEIFGFEEKVIIAAQKVLTFFKYEESVKEVD